MIVMPDRIDVGWLRRNGACSEGVRDFARVFGFGADLTARNLRRAAEADLDLDWLVSTLPLSIERKAEVDADPAVRKAWRAWQAALDATWRGHGAGRIDRADEARVEYYQAVAEALIRVLDAVEAEVAMSDALAIAGVE